MVAEDAPVLQASDRVLAPGAASSVPTPSSIAHDAVVPKHWRDELDHAPVTAVGEHPTMSPT